MDNVYCSLIVKVVLRLPEGLVHISLLVVSFCIVMEIGYCCSSIIGVGHICGYGCFASHSFVVVVSFNAELIFVICV